MRFVPREHGLHLTINEDIEGPLGVSPLESLHATHALHEAAWRFARSYLENGMFPSGVVSLPERATLKQAELTRELIEQLQTGIERGGKPAVLGFGEWQQVTATPEGAKLVELAKASREEVATAYRMAWLGNVEDMNRATAEQARQAFIRDVVGEDVGVLETELNAQVIQTSRQWANAGVFVEAELGELLRPDMEAMASIIQSEVGAPVLTPNEGRGLLNREPLADPQADRLVFNPGTPQSGRLATAPDVGELVERARHANGKLSGNKGV
jgi:HK97 family phage portal protein